MDNLQRALGKLIKQQRAALSLTLQDVSDRSGVTASHLARIERGERFPSGRVLKQVAAPLSFDEGELMALAGYLTRASADIQGNVLTLGRGRLDPLVAEMPSKEPISVQRAAIGVLNLLKQLQKAIERSEFKEVRTETECFSARSAQMENVINGEIQPSGSTHVQ